MFGRSELERLQQQKELLVARSDANRLLLALEFQRLRSVMYWKREAVRNLRERPLLSGGLAVGAGVLAFKLLRHPGALLKWAGRLGGAGSTAVSLWRLFARK